MNLADKFIGQARVMPYNCNRQLVADFNGDGVDDIYCPSTVQGKKDGKFWFGGPDLVYISDGKGHWIRTAEAGEMVDKNTVLTTDFLTAVLPQILITMAI